MENNIKNVSICIPTYNQGAFIEKAVRSAYEQSLKPFEIIVSDDCSTDSTESILNKLSIEIPVLKVFRQENNVGISRNVNDCLRRATGEFVIRLDSDDCLGEEYTEKLLELFEKYPEAGYGHAAVQEIDQHGKTLLKRKLFRTTGFQSAEVALRTAISGYKVAANILMFRKSALVAADYITAKMDFAEDYYLCTKIADLGFGNIYSDEILSYYRVWVDVGKVRQRRKLAEIVGLRHVFEEVLEPAFIKRGWSLVKLYSKRTEMACNHADCLSWETYSGEEKKQLELAILKLSSKSKVKYIISIYKYGFGNILMVYKKLLIWPKNFIKRMFLMQR